MQGLRLKVGPLLHLRVGRWVCPTIGHLASLRPDRHWDTRIGRRLTSVGEAPFAPVQPMPAKSPVIVRPVRDADIPAITAIYSHAVLHGLASFEVDAPDAAEMTKRMRAVVDAGFPYLVAEVDGRVLGYAYAGLYRTRPAYWNSAENSVYVSPDAHRLGVGRALLRELIDIMTQRGFRQMIAVIGDSGNAGSIGLHRALGFTFCGTIHSVGYKHGRWLDSVIMQKALGPGDTSPPDRVA